LQRSDDGSIGFRWDVHLQLMPTSLGQDRRRQGRIAAARYGKTGFRYPPAAFEPKAFYDTQPDEEAHEMTSLVRSCNVHGLILDPQRPPAAQTEETFESFPTYKRGHSETPFIHSGHLVIELPYHRDVFTIRETPRTTEAIGMKKSSVSHERIAFVG
jgi:hypothetical protein